MKRTNIIKALSFVSLLLFTGCNGTNEDNSADQINEWSIKINAVDSAGKLGDTNTRIGQVYPSTDGVDRYDLKSSGKPFGGDFMKVVYLIDGIQGDYSTNYHSVKKEQYDSWIFVVKTNDPDRTITLSWPGIFKVTSAEDDYKRVRLNHEFKSYDPIMEKMQLRDMKTGEVISAVMDGTLQSYTFNMDGDTERMFKWEFLTTNADNASQDLSEKESVIELGKLLSKKYEKIIESRFLPPEFDQEEAE